MKTTNKKIDEVYDINDFHDFHTTLYYPKSLGLKGKEPIRIPIKLLRKIVSVYFDIYFKELYFIRRPMYFLFSGYLQVVRTQQAVLKQKVLKKESLALFWGGRASFVFAYYTQIIKLTGKANKLPAIEKMCLRNNDIAKFPKFDQTYKKKLWSAD